MRCPFCQNHTIAHPGARPTAHPPSPHPAGEPKLVALTPEALLADARRLGVPSVAFTYNEPTLQAEYILEAAPLLREAGVGVALVTNGMLSAQALEELLPWIDALNVDVKTFSAANYTKMGGDLATVKRNVARLVQAGVHVELTCLVVPGISDDIAAFAAMTDWIAGISPDIPLHISRYFPAYRYSAPATPLPLLQRFMEVARERLVHVYGGNI